MQSKRQDCPGEEQRRPCLPDWDQAGGCWRVYTGDSANHLRRHASCITNILAATYRLHLLTQNVISYQSILHQCHLVSPILCVTELYRHASVCSTYPSQVPQPTPTHLPISDLHFFVLEGWKEKIPAYRGTSKSKCAREPDYTYPSQSVVALWQLVEIKRLVSWIAIEEHVDVHSVKVRNKIG